MKQSCLTSTQEHENAHLFTRQLVYLFTLFRMKRIMFFITAYICFSCNSMTINIDEIIAKYDSVDFTMLKNRAISFRSIGDTKNTSIYLLNVYRGAFSPYIIEIDNNNDSILRISNHLIISNQGNDYLTLAEIESSMKQFLRYKFCVLQVDTVENVYINPLQQDKPILLRKVPASAPCDFKQFKLYKGNWYVRK
jgi:hypothetical protein